MRINPSETNGRRPQRVGVFLMRLVKAGWCSIAIARKALSTVASGDTSHPLKCPIDAIRTRSPNRAVYMMLSLTIRFGRSSAGGRDGSPVNKGDEDGDGDGDGDSDGMGMGMVNGDGDGAASL